MMSRPGGPSSNSFSKQSRNGSGGYVTGNRKSGQQRKPPGPTSIAPGPAILPSESSLQQQELVLESKITHTQTPSSAIGKSSTSGPVWGAQSSSETSADPTPSRPSSATKPGPSSGGNSYHEEPSGGSSRFGSSRKPTNLLSEEAFPALGAEPTTVAAAAPPQRSPMHTQHRFSDSYESDVYEGWGRGSSSRSSGESSWRSGDRGSSYGGGGGGGGAGGTPNWDHRGDGYHVRALPAQPRYPGEASSRTPSTASPAAVSTPIASIPVTQRADVIRKLDSSDWAAVEPETAPKPHIETPKVHPPISAPIHKAPAPSPSRSNHLEEPDDVVLPPGKNVMRVVGKPVTVLQSDKQREAALQAERDSAKKKELEEQKRKAEEARAKEQEERQRREQESLDRIAHQQEDMKSKALERRLQKQEEERREEEERRKRAAELLAKLPSKPAEPSPVQSASVGSHTGSQSHTHHPQRDPQQPIHIARRPQQGSRETLFQHPAGSGSSSAAANSTHSESPSAAESAGSWWKAKKYQAQAEPVSTTQVPAFSSRDHHGANPQHSPSHQSQQQQASTHVAQAASVPATQPHNATATPKRGGWKPSGQNASSQASTAHSEVNANTEYVPSTTHNTSASTTHLTTAHATTSQGNAVVSPSKSAGIQVPAAPGKPVWGVQQAAASPARLSDIMSKQAADASREDAAPHQPREHHQREPHHPREHQQHATKTNEHAAAPAGGKKRDFKERKHAQSEIPSTTTTGHAHAQQQHHEGAAAAAPHARKERGERPERPERSQQHQRGPRINDRARPAAPGQDEYDPNVLQQQPQQHEERPHQRKTSTYKPKEDSHHVGARTKTSEPISNESSSSSPVVAPASSTDSQGHPAQRHQTKYRAKSEVPSTSTAASSAATTTTTTAATTTTTTTTTTTPAETKTTKVPWYAAAAATQRQEAAAAASASGSSSTEKGGSRVDGYGDRTTTKGGKFRAREDSTTASPSAAHAHSNNKAPKHQAQKSETQTETAPAAATSPVAASPAAPSSTLASTPTASSTQATTAPTTTTTTTAANTERANGRKSNKREYKPKHDTSAATTTSNASPAVEPAATKEEPTPIAAPVAVSSPAAASPKTAQQAQRKDNRAAKGSVPQFRPKVTAESAPAVETPASSTSSSPAPASTNAAPAVVAPVPAKPVIATQNASPATSSSTSPAPKPAEKSASPAHGGATKKDGETHQRKARPEKTRANAVPSSASPSTTETAPATATAATTTDETAVPTTVFNSTERPPRPAPKPTRADMSDSWKSDKQAKKAATTVESPSSTSPAPVVATSQTSAAPTQEQSATSSQSPAETGTKSRGAKKAVRAPRSESPTQEQGEKQEKRKPAAGGNKYEKKNNSHRDSPSAPSLGEASATAPVASSGGDQATLEPEKKDAHVAGADTNTAKPAEAAPAGEAEASTASSSDATQQQRNPRGPSQHRHGHSNSRSHGPKTIQYRQKA